MKKTAKSPKLSWKQRLTASRFVGDGVTYWQKDEYEFTRDAPEGFVELKGDGVTC